MIEHAHVLLIGACGGIIVGTLSTAFFYQERVLTRYRREYQSLRNECIRYRHGYETATHDECSCTINSRLKISPRCVVHRAYWLAQLCGSLPFDDEPQREE
jgi:hypothetical protein